MPPNDDCASPVANRQSDESPRQVEPKVHVELESAQGEWIQLPIAFDSFIQAVDYVVELRDRGYFLAGIGHARVL